ncbi:transcription initiation factor TFIID subunit 7-like [Epargyreus clarus]|uniref:transcription initiation factor TFIID subunit 7-like n=1 Tax=Epargyreus clarus TaxID=520877 RepID=UPI003C3075DC
MNKDRREPDYPTELESQFILRLPEEPAKTLREVLKCGENLKNRLTIQVESDMRNGEVRFDHWLMHGKIVDLPTIVESLKTIDNKSFYKTADICQMMICKEEPDQQPAEEESPTKNKKKDPFKVDKKFLYPHGITPPTKNVRKRRFRKTLKKKYVEAPEIEKEVKRLLRADNEAVSVSWEVIKDEDDQPGQPAPPPPEPVAPAPSKPGKKQKSPKRRKSTGKKSETATTSTTKKINESSNVVDIFGGAVSDSDAEDDHVNVEMVEGQISPYDSRVSDTNSMLSLSDRRDSFSTSFDPQIFNTPQLQPRSGKKSSRSRAPTPSTSAISKSAALESSEDDDYQSRDMNKDNMTLRIEQLRTELEELKQRRQRTQHEIAGMENLALRQRFQDILHTLNQDIMYKEMEYQGMITLQTSEDI